MARRDRPHALTRRGGAQTCTFRPQRLTPVTPPRAGADAASIKGMDKFTARQAEARRKRAQAEADAAAAEEALKQVRTRRAL